MNGHITIQWTKKTQKTRELYLMQILQTTVKTACSFFHS